MKSSCGNVFELKKKKTRIDSSLADEAIKKKMKKRIFFCAKPKFGSSVQFQNHNANIFDLAHVWSLRDCRTVVVTFERVFPSIAFCVFGRATWRLIQALDQTANSMTGNSPIAAAPGIDGQLLPVFGVLEAVSDSEDSITRIVH